MTLLSALALFGTMLILAAIPGPGVFTVIARSVSGGVLHGTATSIGILFGDYVFIGLCLSGLAYVADLMGNAFVVIKYLGAAYLIWLGINLVRAHTRFSEIETTANHSLHSSLSLGLLTTLSNPKAILFYLSFFPAFLPVNAIDAADVLTIYAIATLSVGGVMLIYTWATVRARRYLQSGSTNRSFNMVGGSVLVCAGLWMALRSS
ncbi:LysE family translocator [Microbulbifer sp.]|uniref:LysE family translocator n=1 Tax=Microbulbifer sp. TaxID=1908541 RepID=UPI002F957CA9